MSKVTLENFREHYATHEKSTSWWYHDVRGIALRRVCGKCVHLLPLQYRPEVLGISGSYEEAVDEPIEADGDW